MPAVEEIEETEETTASDGRHARREKNRDAVVTAMLGLYREGIVTPSSEQIAGRAGVSARSVFRYFSDVDDLAREAIARQQQHLAPLWPVEVDTAQPLPRRIESFVAARTRLLEAMGEVGRIARLRAVDQPLIRRELDRVRRALRAQLAEVFAPELAALPPAESAATLAAADALTTWEAHDLMVHDQTLTPEEIRATLTVALGRLLAPGEARR